MGSCIELPFTYLWGTEGVFYFTKKKKNSLNRKFVDMILRIDMTVSLKGN